MTARHQVDRLRHIPGIGVDRMGNAADALKDKSILRLENLDTDVRPPPEALAATQLAIDNDDCNSYLPFLGHHDLRQAVCELVSAQSGVNYDPIKNCVVCAGGLGGILNVLLATLNPGDEVIVTDPIYAGLINRIRLAGGVPVFVPLVPGELGWRLDVDALQQACSERTRMVLMMSPSMPTGFVANPAEWDAIAQVCHKTQAWLLLDACMQRLLFDGRQPFHPASLPGMAQRVITVGSVSKEYRMIGWRVGWVVAPPELIDDVALVSLTNVVCQVGIGMPGARAAIKSADDGVAAFCLELQHRRDYLLAQLRDLPVVPPHGGWSLLINVAKLGMTPERASELLLAKGRIAATGMTGWGPQAHQYVRFVFSNEPDARLLDVRQRIRVAWGT